jgi:hypothetical protein
VYLVSILSVRRLQEWKFIVQECENVVKICQKFEADVESGKALSNKYSEALAFLQGILSHALAVRSSRLAV